MILQEQAEQYATQEYCQDCHGFNGRVCVGNAICDGFKGKVNEILKEWATEDTKEEAREK